MGAGARTEPGGDAVIEISFRSKQGCPFDAAYLKERIPVKSTDGGISQTANAGLSKKKLDRRLMIVYIDKYL